VEVFVLKDFDPNKINIYTKRRGAALNLRKRHVGASTALHWVNSFRICTISGISGLKAFESISYGHCGVTVSLTNSATRPRVLRLFTLHTAAPMLHSTLRMILTAAKRIITATMSLSITSTTTKSTIFASGAWNG
jgi:hypothetical protein